MISNAPFSIFTMYEEHRCLSFEQQSIAQGSHSSAKHHDDHLHTFPSLPESFRFINEEIDKSLFRKRNSLTQSSQSRLKASIASISWLTVLQDLFASRSVFLDGENSTIMPEDMTICWSLSDEDSDVSTVPGFDDDWENLSDNDESEEDTFCVETILRRVLTSDDEDEETVLVSFSTIAANE